MSTARLYPPTRIRLVPEARIAKPAPPPLLVAPSWRDRMRHPFATSLRITRRDQRQCVVQAPPNWPVVWLSLAFFLAAYGLGGWALANGATLLDPVDTFLVGIVVIALLHVALRYLFAPLGCDQTYLFDKPMDELKVTTRGFFRDRVERYRLRDIVKLHLNRVDDGIYDAHTMLVIFKGGGTLQVPARPGVPKRVAATVDVLEAFLGVAR